MASPVVAPKSHAPAGADADAQSSGRIRTMADEESARARAKSPRLDEPEPDQVHETIRAIAERSDVLRPLMNVQPEGTSSTDSSMASWTLVRAEVRNPEGGSTGRRLVMPCDLSNYDWFEETETVGEPEQERKCGLCQSLPARAEYVVIEISVTAAFRPRLHYGFCPFCFARALELVRQSQDDPSGLPRVYFKVHHDYRSLRKVEPEEIERDLRRSRPWRELARDADGVLTKDELLTFCPDFYHQARALLEKMIGRCEHERRSKQAAAVEQADPCCGSFDTLGGPKGSSRGSRCC